MRGYLQECGQFKDSCIPSNSSLGCLLTPETCSHEAICMAGNLTFGGSLHSTIHIAYITTLRKEELENLINSRYFLKVIIVYFINLSSLPLERGV